MNYDEEMLGDQTKKPSRLMFYLIVASAISLFLVFFASSKGYLPHYTLMIDGNKWEWVRDDATYLATQPAKQRKYDDIDEANLKIIQANRAEEYRRYNPPKQIDQVQDDSNQDEFPAIAISAPESAQQEQEQQPSRSGQIVKCLSSSGAIVYQNQDCASSGLRPLKAFKNQELKGSLSDAQSTKILAKQDDSYSPSIVTLNVDEKKETLLCKQIASDREYIRSQQRNRSTQSLRHEYDRLTKRWHAECF